MNSSERRANLALSWAFILLLPAAALALLTRATQARTPSQGMALQQRESPTPTDRPTQTPTDPPRPTDTPPPRPTATDEPVSETQPTSTVPSIAIASPTPTSMPITILTPTPIIDPYEHQFPLTLPSPTPTAPSVVGPEVPDLRITHLEVTQGMQNQWNDMPLAAERRTYVRIYVETDGGDYSEIKGALRGIRGGQQLGIVYAENQPIIAHEDGGDRLDVDDSLYVHVPKDWTEEGELLLEAFVYAVVPSAPFDHEPDADNNFFEAEVSFQEAAPVNLSMLPIHLHVGYDNDNPEKLYTLQEPGAWSILYGMLRYIPTANFYLYPPPVEKLYCVTGPIDAVVSGEGDAFTGHGGCEFDLQAPGGMQYVTLVMALMDALTDDPADDLIYYGMVHPDFDGQMTFYKEDDTTIEFDGIALNGQAYGIMPSGTWDSSPWYMPGAHILAHEAAHRLGLAHANCRGDEEDGGGLDPEFPWAFPDCSLATVVEDGFYGFDVLHPIMPGVNGPTVISNDPNEAEPNRGFPTMGYQKPHWPDAYHYCQLLLNLGVDCDPYGAVQVAGRATGGHQLSPRNPPLGPYQTHQKPAQQPSSFVLVAGMLNEVERTATLVNVSVLDEPPVDMEDPSELASRRTGYEVALLDAAGETLASTPIFDTTLAHELPLHSAFLVGLPFPQATDRVVVRLGEQIAAQRSVSPAVPVVEVLAPSGGEVFDQPFDILWEASDADGDDLLYTVQYSSDGGNTWQALALNLPEPHYRLGSLDTLAGSEEGLIRVLANDGVNVGSDISDGTFTVPNSPPLPAIYSPGHSKVFASGAEIVLSGSATDREDGLLPADALRWDSDQDGDLGAGDYLTTRNLSPGRHVLTLTAIDSQGAENQAVIAIAVDPNVVIQRPDQAEQEQVAAIFAGDVPESPDSGPPSVDQQAPDDEDITPPSWLLIAGLAAAALIGLALFIPLIRSLLKR